MRGETVTVVRSTPGGTDEYGDPVTGATTEHDLEGVLVAPRVSTENSTYGRAGVIVGLTAYAPPGSDVTRRDQLRVRGVMYDIEGKPGVWDNGSHGSPGGVEIALMDAEG